MRSLVLPVAAAALLALAAVAALELVRPAAPTAAEVAQRIEAELRCPDCQSLSVAESRTAAAAAIRAEIVEQLGAGRSPGEIRRHFVDRYGEWILLAPTDPLAWWLPAVAVAAGAVAFGRWWLTDRRGAPSRPGGPPPPTDTDRRRIREQAEALDD